MSVRQLRRELARVGGGLEIGIRHQLERGDRRSRLRSLAIEVPAAIAILLAIPVAIPVASPVAIPVAPSVASAATAAVTVVAWARPAGFAGSAGRPDIRGLATLWRPVHDFAAVAAATTPVVRLRRGVALTRPRRGALA